MQKQQQLCLGKDVSLFLLGLADLVILDEMKR
jgi:hypothetical protein